MLRGDPDDWARRGSPALAWTGERLFVYGGNPVPSGSESAAEVEPLDDAALIDPVSGDIDRLPDPPFSRPLRVQPAAVTVGDEVVLVGQACREPEDDVERACAPGAYRAAVYSIPDDEWREVELPTPLQAITNGLSEPVGATSDGRAVLLLGPRGGFGAFVNRDVWTYDPAEDVWEALPPPGTLVEGACLADDAVVVGSGLLPDTSVGGPTLRVLALNGEARVWFPTEPAGVVPTGEIASMTCGDDLVLFDDGEDMLEVFDLGAEGGWREPAPPPVDDVHAFRLWADSEFLFLDADAPTLAYDPEDDSWRGIEGSSPTGLRSVWTGEAVVGWPGRTDAPVMFEVD